MNAGYIPTTQLITVLKRAKDGDDLGKKISRAIELVEGVLDDLGEEAVAISFNGGKDCTVLLHLFAAVLYARHTSSLPRELQPSHTKVTIPPSTHSSSTTSTTSIQASTPAQPPPTLPTPAPTPTFQTPTATHHLPLSSTSTDPISSDTNSDSLLQNPPYPPIKSVYITAPNPFPQLETFVLDCTSRYNLDLWRFGGGMKAALEEYLGCGGGKGVRGVLVGTRRGDPNGDVEALAPTDPSWPDFLRIHPILDWSYADIWAFLIELEVKWCELYDEGYTSLGSTTNTSPNPLLRNPSSPSGWDPAWKLQDESQERAGRGVVPQLQQTQAQS